MEYAAYVELRLANNPVLGALESGYPLPDIRVLTPRQLEVCLLLAVTGWSYEAAARQLCLAPGTVKNLVHAALRKSGARNMNILCYALGRLLE